MKGGREIKAGEKDSKKGEKGVYIAAQFLSVLQDIHTHGCNFVSIHKVSLSWFGGIRLCVSQTSFC